MPVAIASVWGTTGGTVAWRATSRGTRATFIARSIATGSRLSLTRALCASSIGCISAGIFTVVIFVIAAIISQCFNNCWH